MSHVRLRRLVRPVDLRVSRHHVVFHAARVRAGRRRPGIPHHARGHTSVGVAVEGAHGRVEHACVDGEAIVDRSVSDETVQKT